MTGTLLFSHAIRKLRGARTLDEIHELSGIRPAVWAYYEAGLAFPDSTQRAKIAVIESEEESIDGTWVLLSGAEAAARNLNVLLSKRKIVFNDKDFEKEIERQINSKCLTLQKSEIKKLASSFMVPVSSLTVSLYGCALEEGVRGEVREWRAKHRLSAEDAASILEENDWAVDVDPDDLVSWESGGSLPENFECISVEMFNELNSGEDAIEEVSQKRSFTPEEGIDERGARDAIKIRDTENIPKRFTAQPENRIENEIRVEEATLSKALKINAPPKPLKAWEENELPYVIHNHFKDSPEILAQMLEDLINEYDIELKLSLTQIHSMNQHSFKGILGDHFRRESLNLEIRCYAPGLSVSHGALKSLLKRSADGEIKVVASTSRVSPLIEEIYSRQGVEFLGPDFILNSLRERLPQINKRHLKHYLKFKYPTEKNASDEYINWKNSKRQAQLMRKQALKELYNL